MAFAGMLERLLDEGRVQLNGIQLPNVEDRRAAEQVLRDFESRYRQEFPGQVPELNLLAAMWAAEMFYGALLILSYRAIDAAGISEILSPPFPGNRDAAGHYSVDLTFRLLPDLHTRAKAASQNDPLLEPIKNWANDWPLSSVGMPGIEPQHLDVILENGSLRAAYIDRIIAKQDHSRLGSPKVQEAILAACGMHPQLAPKLHAAITPKPNLKKAQPA